MRTRGFEPRTSGWKPDTLPLRQARIAIFLVESCEHDSHALPHRALSRRRPRPGGLTLRTGALGRIRTRVNPFRRRAPLHSSHESSERFPAKCAAVRRRKRVVATRPHDPEKACPGLDPGWKPVFGEDHAQRKMEASAGTDPAHSRFADGRVPVSPRRRAGSLKGIELVRVRCSAHRPPRSKRGTLLARASPWKRIGAHERSRTSTLQIRNLAHCPVLLRARW